MPLAARFARLCGAEVILFRVLGSVTTESPQGSLPLGIAKRRLTESGVAKVRVLTGNGEPIAEVLKMVEKVRPDLVAMTTHGRSGWSRLRFGSVAEGLLRSCQVPVLIQRGGGS